MDEDSCNNPPSKWDLLRYIPYLLSSNIDIRFAPSIVNKLPIVTLEEIRNAKDLCPYSMGGCKILEISPSTVLKVGPMVHMGEAEALCLVRKKTTVPVPEVFNAYTIADYGFILMSKISGIPLEKCWKGLTLDCKSSIVRQLSKYIREWRQIEGPFFGSLDGGPCEDILFQHSWDANPRPYGPYATRKAFNQGLVEALCNSRPNAQLTKEDESLVRRILVSGNGDETKVLTHGDLHQSNIMVNDNVVIGIIDWGAAGYSISAREYFCLRWQALDPEWRDLTSNILDGLKIMPTVIGRGVDSSTVIRYRYCHKMFLSATIHERPCC